MNCFDILCIPEGSDKKTITESYERLLQFHDPKEDPDGYKELKKAYNKALKYAKMHDEGFEGKPEAAMTDHETNFKSDVNNKDISSDDLSKLQSYYEEEVNLDKKQKYEINNFLRELKSLYDDFKMRTDVSAWVKILEDNDSLLSCEVSEIVERKIFSFLIRHKNIPSEVWELLDDRFDFTDNEEELFKSFGTYDTNTVLININQPNNLSYEYLDEIEKEKLEDYLNFRELAYYSLKDNNLNDTKKFMMQAYEIWKYDSELLRIIGNYHFLKGDYEFASDFLLEALNINPHDMETKELYDKCKADKEFIQNKEIKSIEKERKKDNSLLKDIMGFIGAIIFVGVVFMLMFLKFALKSMAVHNRTQNKTTSSQQNKKQSTNKKISQSGVQIIDTLDRLNYEIYINGEKIN